LSPFFASFFSLFALAIFVVVEGLCVSWRLLKKEKSEHVSHKNDKTKAGVPFQKEGEV